LGAEKLEKEIEKQNRTLSQSNYISMAKTDAWKARAARVVIVGGGFGGLAAAKALRKAPVKVILVDRTNHHARRQCSRHLLVVYCNRVFRKAFQAAKETGTSASQDSSGARRASVSLTNGIANFPRARKYPPRAMRIDGVFSQYGAP
jgi:pyruvate/2-oxoglutarate dehydrogenase complex dihydrolipoamide dehydrogenase (E3) component